MHDGVVADLVGRADGHRLAVGHDHDPLGHVERHFHVVLDEQQRLVRRELIEELDQPLALIAAVRAILADWEKSVSKKELAAGGS